MSWEGSTCEEAPIKKAQVDVDVPIFDEKAIFSKK